MEQDLSFLRDVELRLRSLTEARRLRPFVAAALTHVQTAKTQAAQAAVGSLLEQQYLREAMEASERLAQLQVALARAEGELRRTAYVVAMLTD